MRCEGDVGSSREPFIIPDGEFNQPDGFGQGARCFPCRVGGEPLLFPFYDHHPIGTLIEIEIEFHRFLARGGQPLQGANDSHELSAGCTQVFLHTDSGDGDRQDSGEEKEDEQHFQECEAG